jgi:hypothetical protein
MTVVLNLTHTFFAMDIARASGLSTTRIHQLDDELMPIRDPQNRRRYSVESLVRFLEKRGITVANAA